MPKFPSRRQVLQWQAAGTLAALYGCGGNKEAMSTPAPNSPKAAGYRMPAETALHELTFMQWPMATDVYKGKKNLASVQQSIAKIARTIAKFEPVVMLGPQSEKSAIAEATNATVEHWDINTNDLWCRDSGPTFVQNTDGSLAIVDMNFNGWGQAQRFDHDGVIARKIAERMELPLFNAGIVGESGGLDFDGTGVIMAHESSWIDNRRNNKVDRDTIEKHLLDSLGAHKMIWSPGLAGHDITDFHIDSLARFVKPGVVLIQLPEQLNPYDPFSKAAFETYETLKKATDLDGNPLELIVLPEPQNIRSQEEEFVASYINYYTCNGAVISAEFGDDKADLQARATLGYLFPDREVVMLNIDPIGENGGGIHCATKQQPAIKV